MNPRIRSKTNPEAPDQRQTTRNATSCRNIYCSPNPKPVGKRKPQKPIRNHNLETQRWQQSRPGESYSVATEDWERVTQILTRFHIPKEPITLYRLTKLDRCSQCELECVKRHYREESQGQMIDEQPINCKESTIATSKLRTRSASQALQQV